MIQRKVIPMKEKRMRTISLMIYKRDARDKVKFMNLKEIQFAVKNFYSDKNLKSAEIMSTELSIPFEEALQFLETVFFETCNARIAVLEQKNK